MASLHNNMMRTQCSNGLCRCTHIIQRFNPLPEPFQARWPVKVDAHSIGEVTVAVYSPRLEKNIGFAMVEVAHAALGTRLDVQAPWGVAAAVVAEKPFIKPTKSLSR